MHQHHHQHNIFGQRQVSSAFVAGIAINFVFVIVEFVAGLYSHSLALMADAGHNLSDVGTMALSLFALQLSRKKATEKYTYGFHKSTILVSLVNAIILLVAVGSIGWEAVQRFIEPAPSNGKVIMLVAGIGIIVNGFSAFFFFRIREQELNARGAFLHLLTDALVSGAVLLAGLVIFYTGIKWIDPLLSLLVMGFVTYSIWGLLKESLDLSLDAVPAGIAVQEIRKLMMEEKGITEVYHIHIWAMSTSRNAITAHLVLQRGMSEARIMEIKKELKHKLEHLNIQHATFETEVESG